MSLPSIDFISENGQGQRVRFSSTRQIYLPQKHSKYSFPDLLFFLIKTQNGVGQPVVLNH